MASETVEQVCERLNVLGPFAFDGGNIVGEILAAHKREIDELKKQVSIAKDAFFKIARRNSSQMVYDIICEAEFKMNHPECRKVVSNG